jgi:hypothetical protein
MAIDIIGMSMGIATHSIEDGGQQNYQYQPGNEIKGERSSHK